MQEKLIHERTVNAPMPGQLLRDLRGRYLRVDEVIHSDVLDGFFIVRLSIGLTEDCAEDVMVLGRTEFAALSAERGLHLVASGESPGNVIHLSSDRDARRRS
jgi:hypothetical protein